MDETKVKIGLEASGAINSVKDLRVALKATKDEMIGLEEGSQAFLDAANRAGELKHQMDEVNQAIRGASSDFGDIVSRSAQLGAGITGAFQAAQGAMSLFGVESENVTEAIKKMQSIMALTQGLAAIDQGIKAYKTLNTTLKAAIATKNALKVATASETVAEVANTTAKTAQTVATESAAKAQWSLNAALSANPLGAILAAITAVIAAVTVVVKKWDDWTGKTERLKNAQEASEKRLKSLNNTIESQKKSLDKLSSSQKYELDLMRAQGKSTDEIKKKQIELTKTTIEETQKRIKALESEYRAALLKEAAASGVTASVKGDAMSFGYKKSGDEEEDKRRKAAAEQIADAYKAIQGLKQNEIDLNKQLRIQEAELATEQRKQAAQKAKDDAKAAKDAKEQALKDKKNKEDKIKLAYEIAQLELDIQKENNKLLEQSDAERIAKERDIENERLTLMQKRLGELSKSSKEYKDLEKAIASQKVAIEGLNKAEEQAIEAETKELRNRVQTLKDSYRDELQVINAEEANKLSAIQAALDKQLITEQEFQDLKTQITAEAEKKRTAITEEQTKQRLEKLEGEKQQQIDMVHNISDVAAASAGLLTDVLNNIADAQDTSTKEGFEKQKKLQIAAATIQMLTGIATAFTGAYTTKSGPWDFALMGIQAATIAASGVANIAKIKAQKFDGASAGAATANLSSTARALSSPIQMTQDIQGAETIGAIKDTRVAVVETDITATQKKVNIAETESIF